MNKPNSRKRPSEEKTREPTGSGNTSNDSGRKRRRGEPPKSTKTNGSSNRKRSRHEELNSIQEKIESSTNSISLTGYWWGKVVYKYIAFSFSCLFCFFFAILQ